MTDLVTPGEIDAEADNLSLGHALAKATPVPWVVDGVDIADNYAAIDTNALNAFSYNDGDTSGLDAVFDGGEAYVFGWLVRDRSTTVSVPGSTISTVYLGYDASAILASGEAPEDSENVILGLDGAFSSGDPRVPLYEVEAGSSVINSVTRVTRVGPIDAVVSPQGPTLYVQDSEPDWNDGDIWINPNPE